MLFMSADDSVNTGRNTGCVCCLPERVLGCTIGGVFGRCLEFPDIFFEGTAGLFSNVESTGAKFFFEPVAHCLGTFRQLVQFR